MKKATKIPMHEMAAKEADFPNFIEAEEIVLSMTLSSEMIVTPKRLPFFLTSSSSRRSRRSLGSKLLISNGASVPVLSRTSINSSELVPNYNIKAEEKVLEK